MAMTKQKKRRYGVRYNTFTSCLSTTMVLMLLGMMVFFVSVADNLSRRMREEMPVAVLLSDSIKDHDLGKLQYDLLQLPGVQDITYISKEQGAKETMEAMGIERDDFLEYNPIGAEIELRLQAEYANKDSIAQMDSLIRCNRYVTDVLSPMAEIDMLNRVIPIVGLIALGIAILLAFISVALINNTMRMSVYARRFTINTMKLVGARYSFIRRPFMKQAFGIALTASLVAGSLLGIGIYALLSLDVYIASLITSSVLWATYGCVIGGGILLTLLCALISVNRFLRMSTDEIFMK